MTTQTLEKQLKPLEEPIQGTLLKWLYLHLPPRPITTKKLHGAYSHAIAILMKALGEEGLSAGDYRSIEQYLQAVVPFVEGYEKKETPLKDVTPEQMLRFLMEQNSLSQYDMASELGGQPVVSEILNGKRRLTREHIERLSARFHTSPATFYPAS